MAQCCIITDNAAQFSRVNFPDNICLRFIEYKTEYSFVNVKDKSKLDSKEFPEHLGLDQKPVIQKPDDKEIQELLETSIKNFDDVFIILHSGKINPVFSTVTNLLGKIRGRAAVHLIDSQSISIGQGYLVQSAIEQISTNPDASQIEQNLREQVPHVYTILCAPGLSYLHTAGYLDAGQSLVGEMLSLYPIFNLEDGNFTPVDKVKTIHSVIEYFIEYIDEFDDLLQVSFLQSTPPSLQEAKLVKQYLEENYPDTLYTEHPHNNYLASLIGPRGFGLVVIEKCN